MNNDILGIPSGVLTWWKPSQYNETYDTQSLKEYFKCPKGEARSLVPRIHSIKQGLPLTDISIETHESNSHFYPIVCQCRIFSSLQHKSAEAQFISLPATVQYTLPA